MHAREEHALHAPEQQADPPAALADRRSHARAAAPSGGSHALASRGATFASIDSRVGQPLGAELPAPPPAAGPARAAGGGGGGSRTAAAAAPARPPERSMVALDLGPHPLDQPVVADARRARGDAGHAAEAAIEVRDHLVRQLRSRSVERLVDQHDPPARRVGLLRPQHVRRTRVQAEAAVDAVLDRPTAPAADGRRMPASGSDPSHEHARVARAGRVEARLHPAHQLERRTARRRRPTASDRAAQRRRRVEQHADRARAAGARATRRAASGATST